MLPCSQCVDWAVIWAAVMRSNDVTAAMLVSQNKEMAAMLVSQIKPIAFSFYANKFFCFSKAIWLTVTWVKTLHRLHDMKLRYTIQAISVARICDLSNQWSVSVLVAWFSWGQRGWQCKHIFVPLSDKLIRLINNRINIPNTCIPGLIVN